jgi:hypothetical protein
MIVIKNEENIKGGRINMVGIANPVILKNEEKILRWLIFYPEDPMIWSRKMVKKLSEETLLKSVILS